jgi:hypothetical protein
VETAAMSTTPPLPAWIRSAQVAGYTTAHAVLPDETRLYGTESLYGDWDGRALLLAKDFAASRVLRSRSAAGETRPYRHEPNLLTNLRLVRFAGPLATSSDPMSCGLVYGSALANLLRDDGEMSGSLPNRREALAYGARVLPFVVEHMPRLEAIVCMGREAWDVTAATFGSRVRWEAAQAAERVLLMGKIAVVVVPHPAARHTTVEHQRAWERATAALGH